MEMPSILYQGHHILLEMTVSKVEVDTMVTKQPSAGESNSAGRRVSVLTAEPFPALFLSLEYDAMRCYCAPSGFHFIIFFLIL